MSNLEEQIKQKSILLRKEMYMYAYESQKSGKMSSSQAKEFIRSYLEEEIIPWEERAYKLLSMIK